MPTRKWSGEKLVNTTTAGDQRNADVAALADGGFVVVWEDESAGADAAIRAQRYDATGKAVGAEMVIAPSVAANDLFAPKVTGLSDGGFYVTWTHDVGGPDNYILGRVYNANGGFVRDQPVVFSFNAVTNADLAAVGGGAAATWVDPTGGGDIYLRLFDSAGVGGGLITVSDYPDGSEGEAVVAASPDGATVAVAWSSGESGDTSVPIRLYTAGGAFITEFFGAAPDDVGYVWSPGICWLNDNQFVLTWRAQTDFIGGHPGEIRLRVLNFDGATVTPAPFSEIVLANTTTLGDQQLPVISALPGGGFVVVWQDFSGVGPDSDSAIRLQAFDASGAKIGGEILVNTTTAGAQAAPSIAALADGRVVVTWTDHSATGGDSSGSAIRMQIVDPRDGLVTGTGAADTLYGHNTVGDEISGFGGADLLIGMGGNDSLFGGAGADVLNAGSGDDEVFGGAGNDKIIGGSGLGDDYYDGEGGIDTVTYMSATQAVSVNLATGIAAGAEIGTDELVNIENAVGGAGNDTLTGKGGANTLNGAGGNDTMAGRNGNDTYLVDSAGDKVIEAVGGGTDKVLASVSYSLQAGQEVEFLRATAPAGTTAINLVGNQFANNIQGNAGKNLLNGGAGNDVLTGLGGNDLFLFNTALNAATNVDVITDFNVAADTVRLDDAIFTALAPGVLPAGAFRIGAAAGDAGDRIIYNSATGALFYDADGTGATAAIRFAKLDPALALTNADFIVV